MEGATPDDLLTGHGAFLRTLARSLVRDDQRVDDVVQDTFTAALERPPARGGDLRGWLATALRRRASNLRRSEARRALRERAAARSEPVRGVDSIASEIEFARRLAAHVEALSPPLREALFLRYYEDLPPRRIAARLGVPVATVKSRLERSLAELRSRLDAEVQGRREEWLGAALAWCVPRRSAVQYVALGAGALGLAALVTTVVQSTRAAPERPSAIESAAVTPAELAHGELAQSAPHDSNQRTSIAAATDEELVVLRGVVEDFALGAEPTGGRPAAGVSVWFNGGDVSLVGTATGEQPKPQRPSVETDRDGRFELTVTRARARARFAGLWVDGTTELRSAESQPIGGFDAGRESDVRLLRYPWGALEGRVVDAHGVALVNVSVRVRGDAGRDAGTAVSNHDGRFRFERVRSADRVGVIAEQAGRVLAWPVEAHPRPRGGFDDVEVVLAERATLRVHTRDSGTPVGAVTATSELDPLLMAPTVADHALVAIADADGLAVLDGVPAGVELELYLGDASERFVRRREGQLVRGLSVSSHDTQPILVAGGKTLELTLPPPALEVPPDVNAPRSSAGAERLPSGDVRVRVESEPTATLAGLLPSAQDFEPCVALHDARGRTVLLRAESRELVPIAETGARGRYVLRDVPAEPVTLLVGTREELERGTPRWTERFDLSGR